MAEKITATTLGNALREQITAELINTLTADGLTVGRIASGKIVFEKPDAQGNDRWVKIEVVIPKESREGEPFDGQALIDEYNDNLVLTAEKARLREQASLEKQAKRAEKDKAKAEKEAKAKAEAEVKAEAE